MDSIHQLPFASVFDLELELDVPSRRHGDGGDDRYRELREMREVFPFSSVFNLELELDFDVPTARSGHVGQRHYQLREIRDVFAQFPFHGVWDMHDWPVQGTNEDVEAGHVIPVEGGGRRGSFEYEEGHREVRSAVQISEGSEDEHAAHSSSPSWHDNWAELYPEENTFMGLGTEHEEAETAESESALESDDASTMTVGSPSVMTFDLHTPPTRAPTLSPTMMLPNSPVFSFSNSFGSGGLKFGGSIDYFNRCRQEEL